MIQLTAPYGSKLADTAAAPFGPEADKHHAETISFYKLMFEQHAPVLVAERMAEYDNASTAEAKEAVIKKMNEEITHESAADYQSDL